MKNFMPPILIVTALMISSCAGNQGWTFFPGVHKISVQQGSKITQDMVDKLRPGMTKAQVNYVLGTPLIADTFDQDRWDFHYILKRGDGSEVKEYLSVFFIDGLLDHFEGDFVPSATDTASESS